MSLKKIILAYFHLFRFHAVAQEAIFPIFGILLIGEKQIIHILIIFIIGLFYHIFLHVLNDYADIEIDKKSKDLTKKPLVSGIIPKKNAIIIALISAIMLYFLTFVFYPKIYAFIFLTISITTGAIYDFYGKRIPGFSDLIMAATFTSLFLFGVSTISFQITNIIIIPTLLIFFGIIFANIVEGGLKDVDHDYLAGAKTIAIITGVKIKNGKLKLSKKFSILSIILLGICLTLYSFLIIQPEINLIQNYKIEFILAIIIILTTIYTLYKFLTIKEFHRSKIKKFYFIINTSVGVLFVISIIPITGWIYALFLIIFPISWYIFINKTLYGKLIQPNI